MGEPGPRSAGGGQLTRGRHPGADAADALDGSPGRSADPTRRRSAARWPVPAPRRSLPAGQDARSAASASRAEINGLCLPLCIVEPADGLAGYRGCRIHAVPALRRRDLGLHYLVCQKPPEYLRWRVGPRAGRLGPFGELAVDEGRSGRDQGEKGGAFRACQRSCADSMSLNAMASTGDRSGSGERGGVVGGELLGRSGQAGRAGTARRR